MNNALAPHAVVVGYDHSDASAAALDWGGRLAESIGAPIRVVHATETIVHIEDITEGLLHPALGHEFALRIAQEGVDRLSASHPALEVSAIGSILDATVALDEASTSASMIVIGSHGRGRVGSLMLGSNAYAISGHASCPVIVVRDARAPLPGPERPVVVGTDGSVSAIHAVDAAADVAQQFQAPLVVISSWTPPPPDPWDRPPVGYPTVAASSSARENKAYEANRESMARVRSGHPSQELEGSVVEARPEQAIMQASPDAAMLVLGSRGHNKLMGALLGSTARAVLHHSTTPVMIAH